MNEESSEEKVLEEDPLVATVPRYIINLDDPPEERWDQVIADYADQWDNVQKILKRTLQDLTGKVLGSIIDKLLSGIMSTANSLGAVFYHKELTAISAKSGLKLGRLVLLQLVYEASSCCTSIVLPDMEGNLHHIRTMDWGMDFLEPLTVELDFRKGGQTVFMATSWAGYVGVLTGMRPGSYSVSINFRVTDEGTFWGNLKNALTACWPIGFLLREIFETEPSFDTAVRFLSNSELIAPCYVTICGVTEGQGALLTRDRKREQNRWDLSELGTIVQTNIDHWRDDDQQDIMDSVERRELARELIEKLKVVNKDSLWEMMSTKPIYNTITVYGAYMSPRDGYLETRIPIKHHGFKPALAIKTLKNHLLYIPVSQISTPDLRTKNRLLTLGDNTTQEESSEDK